MGKRYHLGLDIGTSSIGWAVMDDDFKIMRVKGKKGIGVRLFEEGKTAAERRGYRTTRRRYSRRKWRLNLLEEIFDPEIVKVDPTFFARLKESNLSPKDDRKQYSGNLIFPEKTKEEIREWTEKYPTIYHLRNALMTGNRQFDIREVYLALHHIVKYRGNFLFNGNFQTGEVNLSDRFDDINSAFISACGEEKAPQIPSELYNEIQELFFDKNTRKLDKQKQLATKLSQDNDKDWSTQFSKALFGYKTKFKVVLQSDEDLDDFQLDSDDADDKIASISEQVDDDRGSILDNIKILYSRITLNEIVPDGKTLSQSMIEKYNLHRDHLKEIKDQLKHTDNWVKFDDLYSQYVNGKLESDRLKKLSSDDFYKKVLTLFDGELKTRVKEWQEKGEFLPKQRTGSNGVIPHQLHQNELDQIIENQAKYYPWLATLNPNENRQRVAKYKLSELVAFRIPYYVGPMVTKDQSNFAWMVKKSDEKEITPWNFDQVVDRDKSAEEFINRMTTKDTYLIGEDVLPAKSLLYEKFTVLNELNNIRINGEHLTTDEKHQVYRDLFQNAKSISTKKFHNYLVCNLNKPNHLNITGFSDLTKFNSSLDSYIDLKKIFADRIDDQDLQDDFEKMIRWSTVFEDKQIFERKLSEINWLTDQERSEVAKLRYRGWGRLSKRLLTGIHDENGQRIIDALWNSPKNFMQIQAEAAFNKQINDLNTKELSNNNVEDVLADAYTSPQNKKAIRQVLLVVEDIQKAMHGDAPTSISLEFAREEQESSRTRSRRATLSAIYRQVSDEIVSTTVKGELGKATSISDRLYLYFTQGGRDMYTGEPINIDEISRGYEIDHILPQSFIKDDSLDNRVLVKGAINNGKSANCVMDQSWAPDRLAWWKKLLDNRLISRKKYQSLTLPHGKINKYSQNGFINRQLVETRQVIKLVANILNDQYSNDDTKIIVVKAALNSQLRGFLELFKNRNINDYHHGMDAYLSTFIGNYLYKKYPKLRSYFVYGEFKKFSGKQNLKSFNFLHDLEDDSINIISNDDGEIVGSHHEMIEELEKVYKYKYMLVSKEVYSYSGKLFNDTVYTHEKNKLIPLKKDKPTSIYGGYSSEKSAYMVIIKILKKNKSNIYKVVGIPEIYSEKLEKLKLDDTKTYVEKFREIINKQLNKSEINNYSIVLDKVMYNQLIFENGEWMTLGSSKERHNAKQLVLENKIIAILDEESRRAISRKDGISSELDMVYEQLINAIRKDFPLYKKYIETLENHKDEFRQLPINSKYDSKGKKSSDGKFDIINDIITGLHANGTRKDIKILGLSEFGRFKSVITFSENAKLIYQSPTGLFERRVKLKDLSK
ncbi:type II CRISPR RNA-guided endonuclease Cas9 [uncultured Limosilactobacillus sp.]|uniref:type II CRISPR RNA-guided endonuclease Cas9 n=2 Tax=Limosilactobacillus TaxID=2742598 RepID=UPI0025E138AA|nr:type II CRISPR RNA-guided endonuclease Cas9 [uncultured Limosilactobacillus sp.]